MRALTIWQPWASLIIAGAKPYEFRHHKAPRGIIGQRIVIHAGINRADLAEIPGLLFDLRAGVPRLGTRDPAAIMAAITLLETCVMGATSLPFGAAIGTALLGEPRTALDLFGAEMDTRDIDETIWGWPLSEIEPWEKPAPAKGAQGFWVWDGDGAGVAGDHRCHARGCDSVIPPRLLMCPRHWRLVPRALQRDIWREVNSGCAREKQSGAYLEAMRHAIEAVAEAEARSAG